jgi:hypothetical protein
MFVTSDTLCTDNNRCSSASTDFGRNTDNKEYIPDNIHMLLIPEISPDIAKLADRKEDYCPFPILIPKCQQLHRMNNILYANFPMCNIM